MARRELAGYLLAANTQRRVRPRRFSRPRVKTSLGEIITKPRRTKEAIVGDDLTQTLLQNTVSLCATRRCVDFGYGYVFVSLVEVPFVESIGGKLAREVVGDKRSIELINQTFTTVTNGFRRKPERNSIFRRMVPGRSSSLDNTLCFILSVLFSSKHTLGFV